MASTRQAERIRQREDQILEPPPRLTPPTVISDDVRVMAAPPPRSLDDLPHNDLLMLHSPELLRRYRPLALYFLGEGALAPRDRELAILRLAWLCQAPFEWGEHVAFGKKVGLTTEEVERITEGSAAAGWTAHDHAILRAVEELLADAMISDATWEALARTLDERQLVELPILVGQYQGVAYYFNSLRIPLRESNPGLSAR